MIESKFLDIKNAFYAFFQKKLEKLTQNSLILSKIDEIILFFISLILVSSTFFESEKIAVFAIAAILLTVVKLFTKSGAKVRLTGWDAAIFVYFVICFISTINSTLLPQSIHGFLKTVIYIIYYYCAANYFQTNQNKIKYVFVLVGILCSAEALIALYQNFAGVEQISTWQDSNYINPEDAIARAYGTLKPYNPNLLGGYLLAGIPYLAGAAAIFLVKKNYKLFMTGCVLFLICSLAVFVTGSRGAYLGLGAILAGLVLVGWLILKTDFSHQEKLKTLYKKAVTAMAGLIVLVLIAVPKITKRLLSIFLLRGDSSTSFRMNVYHSSWQMFCDNWFLGIGAGNQTFREIYGLYMLTGFDALSTYSVPLEIAVEAGIFALIAFVLFLVLFLTDSFKFLLKNDTNDLTGKVIVSAAILVILGVMTHGMFDTIFFRPQVQFLFWTVLAMSSAVLIEKNTKEA